MNITLETPPLTSTLSIIEIQEQIVQEFKALVDWDARYKHIIHLGKGVQGFPEEARTADNIIKGCQSQVWMLAELRADGRVYFQADSDAMIVRGLVSLLLRLYSGQTPDTIIATAPEFFERIDMAKHLSMQRSNGLYSMIKQMKFYALAFKMQQDM